MYRSDIVWENQLNQHEREYSSNLVMKKTNNISLCWDGMHLEYYYESLQTIRSIYSTALRMIQELITYNNQSSWFQGEALCKVSIWVFWGKIIEPASTWRFLKPRQVMQIDKCVFLFPQHTYFAGQSVCSKVRMNALRICMGAVRSCWF